MSSIIEEALRLVHGDRQRAYGHPAEDFARTGRMWGAILGIPDVTPRKVALCMVALKVSREAFAHKDDTLVDIAGYTETLALIEEREKGNGDDRYHRYGDSVNNTPIYPGSEHVTASTVTVLPTATASSSASKQASTASGTWTCEVCGGTEPLSPPWVIHTCTSRPRRSWWPL